jgi:hypothetical protein
MSKTLRQILNDGDPEELLALFTFEDADDLKKVILKFNLWARFSFPQFFKSEDAKFHKQIDELNTRAYLGLISSFTNIGFRGCAKTTRTKLFIAYVIANDRRPTRRRYMKVLSLDGGNSKQTVTDIYNLLIDPTVRQLYPEVFQKTEAKREETMSVFTTATGVKLLADTVGSDQRGQIQDDARPDFIYFDDFETRKSLRSAVITKAIWDNMEEARTGLSIDGAAIYTSNYLSERGNVHRLVEKNTPRTPVLITPILDDNRVPTWPSRYTPEQIKQIREDADDFEGEYMCRPSASKDVYFDRDSLDRQKPKEPFDEIAGLKLFVKYDPMNRIGGGADVAGGVSLDSSTSVFIDFDKMPAQVIATYKNNEVAPDAFGHVLAGHGKRFGECYIGVERNNHGHATLAILKTIYPTAKIHKTFRNDIKVVFQNPTEYGWDTNPATKPQMLADLAKAVEDGLIELNDADLIRECRGYTLNDLMEKEVDPRLTTRHFDLMIAAAIAWQMNPFIKKPTNKPPYDQWTARAEKKKPLNPAR